MHVIRLPPRSINGKKNHRPFQDVRQRMDGASFEEKKLARTKFGLLALVADPKCSFSGKDVEVFVAFYVIMRGRTLIDPKNPCAGRLTINQIMIQQHCCRCRWKGRRHGSDVETTRRR